MIPADDPRSIEAAVARLAAGGLVAMPTETVYGLGADATNGEAVARIFEAKGRPRFNPLISHVCDLDMARRLAVFDDLALALAEAFWPGPLTLVLPAALSSPVHPLASAGLPTIAVRMPIGVMAEIARRLDAPIAAPSANRSGRVSPTTAAHVEASLGGAVDLVLDAGPAAVGLESTILKVADGRLHLLRAGGLDPAEIEAATGLAVLRTAPGPAIEAPGQLVSHYAPAGAVRLDAAWVEPGEALVTFGGLELPGMEAAAAVFDLSPSGSLREAASKLFAVLAALDRPEIERIAVVPIPRHGLGEALNDRLSRAAAPRSLVTPG
ncbi:MULTISPECIES: L-threonylcarbamoyladenylate synthase [unclassified Aureimonas]|uniref:L-threonylcarbamoyladenylate synthase n=1 Tax=unclassified Aureimonas TaxID=2615206 RepID=UPI0006FF54F7|nr:MULTISPECIES: L-threonylcarbamoyladenylate synthase [unclassified Aureimonas]KQT65126.1 translation factor Sua5 [Aureimonas sp. Leaf427]KQT76224.1 translation factor Sua5 [Aureimonas sp. Leaf460]